MKPTAIIAFALVTATAVAAVAEHSEINSRRASERKAFTDAEITGLSQTAFGADASRRGDEPHPQVRRPGAATRGKPRGPTAAPKS